MFDNDVQSRKQHSSIFSISGGILISFSDEHLSNEYFSIEITDDGSSISTKFMHPAKAFDPIIFTVGGIEICVSDSQS